MPSQYAGNAGNISSNLPAAVNIASSTNSTPIAITTSTAHGLTTGVTVDVVGHQANTNANGTRQVTVTGTNTFTLTGSVTTGVVGGATGTVQSLQPGPTYQIPSDGDSFNAAAFNVAYEALGDRSAFLALSTGAFKMAILQFFTNTTVLTWGSLTTSDTNPHTIGSPFTVPGVEAADVVDLELVTSYTQATNSGYLSFGYDVTVPGGTPTATFINGSNSVMLVTATVSAIVVRGIVTVPAKVGTLNVWPVTQVLGGGGAGTTTLFGNYTAVVKVWRPTFMPQ